ncbi:MAG TPA: hypothetical protein GXZ79_00720 [Acholeplasma sp.]|nr:hypothetical protein [Acholeplasma sp.]
MYIYKKHVYVQLIMFGLFIIMGVNVLISALAQTLEAQRFTTYITLGLLIILAGAGLLVYFSKSKDTIEISKKSLDHSKYVLYGYFIVYVIHMIVSQFDIKGFKMGIVFGPILIVIAALGVLVQYQTLKNGKDNKTLK